jgi:hypothetical protein
MLLRIDLREAVKQVRDRVAIYHSTPIRARFF